MGNGTFVASILVLAIWIGASHLIGEYAQKKGRSYWGFFLLSTLCLPIGLAVALIASPSDESSAVTSNLVKCEFCAEHIKREAKICKHCGKDVPISSQISNQENTKNDESYYSESELNYLATTVPPVKKIKFKYSDGSEGKKLLRAFTAISFSLWASIFPAIFILAILFYLKETFGVESDTAFEIITIISWVIFFLLITTYAIFRSKTITGMLTSNFLFYLLVSFFIMTNEIRESSHWIAYLGGFFILMLAIISLTLRVRLNKVQYPI
jgi:hypothetical protein